jgi:HAD superfamily hydrolase (TIGR01509 family)
MMPSAVLFDMDGTLIDSEHLWLAGERAVMHELGAEWTHEDQAYCLGGPIERAVDYMLLKSRTEVPHESVLERLLTVMGELYASTPLQWQPGARDLLLEALDANIPTALVTASWRRIINVVELAIDADLGRDAFTFTVGGDEVNHTKPHPEPYLTAAAALGCEPKMCLALEDSPPGAHSAYEAGCKVIAVPHIAEIIAQQNLLPVESLQGQTLQSLWSLFD